MWITLTHSLSLDIQEQLIPVFAGLVWKSCSDSLILIYTIYSHYLHMSCKFCLYYLRNWLIYGMLAPSLLKSLIFRHYVDPGNQILIFMLLHGKKKMSLIKRFFIAESWHMDLSWLRRTQLCVCLKDLWQQGNHLLFITPWTWYGGITWHITPDVAITYTWHDLSPVWMTHVLVHIFLRIKEGSVPWIDIWMLPDV